MPQKPTVGRIVHYVLPATHRWAGEVRPAIIVKVWSETCVQLNVFLDPANDPALPGNDQSSVNYAEGNPGRTWHWPPRD